MDISSLIDKSDSPVPETRNSSDGSEQTSNRATRTEDEQALRPRRSTVSLLLNDERDTTRGDNKPKRYKIAPIYAQSWLRRGSGANGRKTRESPIGMQLSDTQISSVTGMLTPLSGIIPFEDITRKLTEWLYSHIFKLGDQRNLLEIEFKFGVIMDKITENRISLPVLTETVLQPEYANRSTFFTASMNDELFGRANSYLDSLLAEKSDIITKTASKTRDAVFESRQSNDRLRVTYDETGSVIAKITKTRVSDLMIYSPGDLLDIRVSLSLEIPSSENETRRHPTNVRHKNRQSYIQEGIQVDLTSVINPQGQVANQHLMSTKELEIELNPRLLIKYFDSFLDKSDSRAMDKFEELIRLGLDNMRLISRKLSR